MRDLPRRRTLLRAAFVTALTALAVLLAVSPAGAAAAAPSPAPHSARTAHRTADRTAAPKHGHRDKPAKHARPARPGKHPGTAPASPTPSASPAALGPITPVRRAPARPTPPTPRPLMGQTLGGVSYDAPGPPPLAHPERTRTRATAALAANAWARHGRGDRPAVATSVQRAVDHPAAPLLVAGLISLFVLVQHRIDRRDPKLRSGHRPDGPDLRFGPPLRDGRRQPTSP